MCSSGDSGDGGVQCVVSGDSGDGVVQCVVSGDSGDSGDGGGVGLQSSVTPSGGVCVTVHSHPSPRTRGLWSVENV